MKFDNYLMSAVRHDLEVNKIPMLLGEPGIGKSSWLENLATLMRTKSFTLACNQLADKADLTGARLVPTEDGSYKQVFYPHAVIADAIAYAKENPRETPILFLDELNRTTPDVTSEALSIPTMRAIGSVKLPSNLRVVIAGNDKGNIVSLDEASVSRFALYHVQPDVATFLALDDNLNPYVRGVLNAHPEVIFCKESVMTEADVDEDHDYAIDDILGDDDGMHQITTPRTISGISAWLNSYTDAELLDMLGATDIVDGQTVSILQEAIEGHVGATAFARYLYADLSQALMSSPASNTSAQLIIAEPNGYAALKTATTRSEIEELVSQMDDKQRSGCLTYALYERDDNAAIINAIAPLMANIVQQDVFTLVRLMENDDIDHDNVQTLLNSNTPIAASLGVILNTN